MGRSAKIAIGLVVVLAVLLGLNALVTGAETKSAEVTRPDGRILGLRGGELQVVDRGPREASPIVLVHCFTCAIDWWDRMIPRLEGEHRVVAVDLLGHGGSEKPKSGYSIESQAALVAEALGRLGVRDATVAGHSLGGPVAVALAERSPRLVDRLVIVDTVPDRDFGDVGFVGELPFQPVVGEALWRVKPEFSIRDGLEIAFAPGFEVPDEFVEGVRRMTYSAYSGSHEAFEDYTDERSMPERVAALGLPALASMGAEEQIADDPRAALAAYRKASPRTKTLLIPGAGHSPNVERPIETAAIVLRFAAKAARGGRRPERRAGRMQEPMQKRNAVRKRP
ncbi:MAG TPA: alpha/beta hydrolase [Solirubrobacterales bacterium]|nr:alpha/beta hydrolase [Solirubrobacterales bacterium]